MRNTLTNSVALPVHQLTSAKQRDTLTREDGETTYRKKHGKEKTFWIWIWVQNRHKHCDSADRYLVSQKRCKKEKKTILQLANMRRHNEETQGWKNRWGFRLLGYQRCVPLERLILTKSFLNCQFTERVKALRAELKTLKGQRSCSSSDRVRELPSSPNVPVPGPSLTTELLPELGFWEEQCGAQPGQQGVEGAAPFSRL